MSGSSHRRRMAVMAALGLGLLAYGLARGWFAAPAPSEQSLRPALAGADRLRVRTGGTGQRDAGRVRTLFEETDPARIESVIAAIRVDPSANGPPCPCDGQMSFEFYRDGVLIATLGYHGRALRWEGWRGDGALTADAAAALRRWLRSHGVEVIEGEER
jgi:hypothetical protein